MGLSLDLDNCTIQGAGHDKTIWTFKTQDAGAEGLLVTADGITLQDFAIEDTRGNAIKTNAANNLTFRRVRTEWTGGPKADNGAYGLYPVNGTNILVEDCIVKGASDAGVYVGQSKNVIVRRNEVQFNVAGIEIENCYNADVYHNIATNNTGGILVFDMPGLPMKDGRDHRV
jgi:parallel beta-helix repeat protein